MWDGADAQKGAQRGQWDFGEYQKFAFVDTLLPNLYLHQVVFRSETCPTTSNYDSYTSQELGASSSCQLINGLVLREQYPTILASVERDAPPSTIVNENIPTPANVYLAACCCCYLPLLLLLRNCCPRR